MKLPTFASPTGGTDRRRAQSGPRFHRKWVGWALALLLAVTAGCRNNVPVPADAPAPPPPSVRDDATARLVHLDEAQTAELAVRTFEVQAHAEPIVLMVPGTVEPSPEAYAVVSAPIGGRIVRIDAHEGEYVREGQTLAVIESLALASLVGDYLEARAEATFQQQQVDRYGPLVEKRITARSVLEKAEADLRRADALVQAARARLTTTGIDEAALERLATGAERPVVAVTAPRAGTVHEHRIDLGQAVEAYAEMATLVSHAEVLVRGFVSPYEAARVQPGDSVSIHTPGLAAQSIHALVTSVQPAIDSQRRAVSVNVRVATPDRELVPGQSVELEIVTTATQAVVHVPTSAIVYEGNEATVFVRRDARTFERRAVVLGRVGDADAVVTTGLEPGEEVAVSQVFSLKALGRYAQYAEE